MSEDRDEGSKAQHDCLCQLAYFTLQILNVLTPLTLGYSWEKAITHKSFGASYCTMLLSGSV